MERFKYRVQKVQDTDIEVVAESQEEADRMLAEFVGEECTLQSHGIKENGKLGMLGRNKKGVYAIADHEIRPLLRWGATGDGDPRPCYELHGSLQFV